MDINDPSDYAQKANEVSAIMAQVVKTPPDFLDFLKLQGSALKRVMNSVGLAYFVHDGQGVSCLVSDNLNTLSLDKSATQRDVFVRAIKQVAETGEDITLGKDDVPSELLHGQSVDEVPSPHQLPLFNQTPYFHFFISIPMDHGIRGVLQIWFDDHVSQKKAALLASLHQICSETELYFQSKQVGQLAGEVGRVHAYTRFLESLGSLDDLSAIQHKIVEYAKDVSGADRVSLLTAKDYQAHNAGLVGKRFDKYVYQCSSGIQIPHDKSKEARVLEELASLLLDKTQEALRASMDKDSSLGLASRGRESIQDLPPAAPSIPPKVNLQWVNRDANETDSSEEELLPYFSVSPMSWATVLPLYDAESHICALLLFEGKSEREEVASSLLSLSAFSSSSGCVLGRTLFWENRWSLRCARAWIDWRDRALDTRKKRRWARCLVPLFLLLGVLLFPVRFHVKALAQVRPEHVQQISSQSLARVVSVFFHEGQSVTSGDLLVQLDVYELELELQRYQGEYLRALTDSDRLLEEGNEVGMQSARLQAKKALAQIERIRYQLGQSSLRAPFDGLVLGPRGLSQKVGQVVQVGEPLVELADPRSWEVRVHLSEQNLVFLEERLRSEGQIPGALKLTFDPSESYPVVLSSIEELSYGLNVQGDEYYFDAVIPLDVDASLQALLKAGFEGRVAFYIGWRPLAYVLFREVFLSIKVNWF